MSKNTLEAVNRLMNNEIEQAQRFFELELTNDPNGAFAHAGMATCWALKNDLENSKVEVARALSGTPQPALAYVARGIIAELEQDTRQAMADLNKALEIDPQFAYAQYIAGTLLSRSGKLDDSIHSLSRAVESNPGFWLARRNLAITYDNRAAHLRALHEAAIVLQSKPSRENVELFLSVLGKAFPLIKWIPFGLTILYFMLEPRSTIGLAILAGIGSGLYLLNYWITKQRTMLLLAGLVAVLGVAYYAVYIRPFASP